MTNPQTEGHSMLLFHEDLRVANSVDDGDGCDISGLLEILGCVTGRRSRRGRWTRPSNGCAHHSAVHCSAARSRSSGYRRWMTATGSDRVHAAHRTPLDRPGGDDRREGDPARLNPGHETRGAVAAGFVLA